MEQFEGKTASGGSFASLEQVTEAHFNRAFDIDVRRMLFTVRKAVPLINKGASVIPTPSTTATIGADSFVVNAASKADLNVAGGRNQI